MRVRSIALLLALMAPLSALADDEWIDRFPGVTEVAQAAFDEIGVTAEKQKNPGLTTDDDAIAVNLAGTFVALRQILALEHDAGPRLSSDGEARFVALVASYQQAELTIGQGWSGRHGYITRAAPTGMGCADEECYRRWFLMHLNASSGRAEYRHRLLERLFACGTLAKELDDLRQAHASSMPYFPSPAVTLSVDPQAAALSPSGCSAYGGDANQNGLCDDWELVPEPTATGAPGKRRSAVGCEIALERVRYASGGGLEVSITPGTAKAGSTVRFRVVRSEFPAIAMDSAVNAQDFDALIESDEAGDAAAHLHAILGAGWTLPDPNTAHPIKDPPKRFWIVDAVSVPSRGQVRCEQPLERWLQSQLNPAQGLHGPFRDAHAALTHDPSAEIAWRMTGTAEVGYLIVRREPNTGGDVYFTTPPQPSSMTGRTVLQPTVQPEDYYASYTKAFDHSCENDARFAVASLVHTHPVPLWYELDPPFDFSMDDFNQAGQLYAPQVISFGPGTLKVALETIAMIDRRDRCYRTFKPAPDQHQFSFLERLGEGRLGENPFYESFTAVVKAQPMSQSGNCEKTQTGSP